MQDPDPRTIARAREGDLDAFEDLVRRYQGDLWRFAFHFTRDRALADDVTQEAFLRAFRFLRGFRGDSKFTSWLFRIARNCAMDAIKARKAHFEKEPAAPLASTDPQARVELQAALAAVLQEWIEQSDDFPAPFRVRDDNPDRISGVQVTPRIPPLRNPAVPPSGERWGQTGP